MQYFSRFLSLSLAGYSKFRSAADKATAIGNIRQLQIANANYATDNNGRFVSSFARDGDGKFTGMWNTNIDFLDLFRGESYESEKHRDYVPVSLLDPKAVRGDGKFNTSLKGSFGAPEVYGVDYGGKNADSSYRLTQLTNPERTAAFVTAIDWHVVYGSRLRWDGTEQPDGRGIIAYRHNGKALVVYYDGRVGELTKADMKEFDKKGGEDNPFWNGFK